VKGTYHYWINGTKADITETFRFTSNGTAGTVIESERHAETFGAYIHVSAVYNGKKLTHFNVEWQNKNQNAVQHANAHYQFEETEILVHRNIDGQEFHERIPIPERFTTLPLLRIFTGKAIRETYIIGHGDIVPVLVPNIQDPNDKVKLLALESSLRSATYLGRDTFVINNEEHTADIFNFTGGNYDHTAKFWVNKNDILLKYQWQQGDTFWEVKLVEIN